MTILMPQAAGGRLTQASAPAAATAGGNGRTSRRRPRGGRYDKNDIRVPGTRQLRVVVLV